MLRRVPSFRRNLPNGVMIRMKSSLARTLLLSFITATGLQVRTLNAQATPSADVSQALDRKLDALELREQPIADAFDQLGDAVGINIAASEEALSLLPWGDQTRLSKVTIRDASVREALIKIAAPFGLEFRVVNDSVFVDASKPLMRINRRATWDELELLRKCNTTAYTNEALDQLNIRYRITSKVDAPALLAEAAAKQAGGTIAKVLEDAAGSLGWVWLPNEDHIVIKTVQAQIANYLSRRVTIKYTNEPLANILLDLADRADTPINFEAGMMLKLPQNSAQHTSLALRQNSIRQGFELLSAHTGIEYRIERDGIHVGLSEAIRKKDGTFGSLPISLRSPYVGKLTVPSEDGTYTFDILLREDDLPEDVLNYRKRIIDEYIARMRAEMSVKKAEETE